MNDRLPILPTTVVGSNPAPEWMERLKTDYFRGRTSRAQLVDVHEMAIKAALRNQKLAGIDIDSTVNCGATTTLNTSSLSCPSSW